MDLVTIASNVFILVLLITFYVLGVYVGFNSAKRLYEEALTKMLLQRAKVRTEDLYPKRDHNE